MIKEKRTEDGQLILFFQGELDHHTAPLARAEMNRALENHQYKEVLLELSDLTFMDSSGIGVLLGRYKKMQPLGITICISGASSNIDKLLKMSGIYTIMPKAEKEVS